MEHHVILTLGRSGSNTLRDMLNQSPEVLNLGEVLGDWNAIRTWQRRLPFIPNDDADFLDWVLNNRAFLGTMNFGRSMRKRQQGAADAAKSFSDIKTFGVKDFSLNFHKYGLETYLQDRPHIKVIGLARTNVVDRMVSNAMLGATGVVAVQKNGPSARKSLRIDPAMIAQLLTDIEEENAQLSAMLQALPASRVRTVDYDDLFSDPAQRQAEMDVLYRFLNVQSVQTQERMKKIIRTDVCDVIENFSDCVAAVKGTAHEALLRGE